MAERSDSCRHCKRVFVKGVVSRRPRSLCSTCYSQPEVRDQYPLLPGGHGNGNGGNGGNAEGRMPREATHHPPGSDGKILVMQERASRKENLHHPDDARHDQHLEE